MLMSIVISCSISKMLADKFLGELFADKELTDEVGINTDPAFCLEPRCRVGKRS